MVAENTLPVYLALQEDFENFWSECPWEDDLRNAQAVCDEVSISFPFLVLSLQVFVAFTSTVSLHWLSSAIAGVLVRWTQRNEDMSAADVHGPCC